METNGIQRTSPLNRSQIGFIISCCLAISIPELFNTEVSRINHGTDSPNIRVLRATEGCLTFVSYCFSWLFLDGFHSRGDGHLSVFRLIMKIADLSLRQMT